MSQAYDNFEWFKINKTGRLDFFETWLEEHFKVSIDIDDEKQRTLSRWFDTYGFLFVKPETSYWDSWDSYAPEWVDEFSGLNVVYDTAILLGEHICRRYGFAFWQFNEDRQGYPGNRKESFCRPTIGGFKKPWKFDPLNISFKLYRGASQVYMAGVGRYGDVLGGPLEAAAYGAENFNPLIE